MKLSIIIVSWNVQQKLRNNLTALFASKADFAYEVFVVDNNSDDETASMVRAEFPQVKLIANQENLGFAKANNQAIKLSSGTYILLLNPDMQVQAGTLQSMVDWFDQHPQAYVASCKLIDEKGDIIPHVRRFPSIIDQLAIVLKIPHLAPSILKKYLAKDFDYEQEAAVDSVRGSFFLIRRPEGALPLLDERYFIWFEEVDYCRQIHGAGLEVWYTPAATCIDFVGASFKQVRRGVTQNYFQDSMLKYFHKWHPRWQYQLLRTAWPIAKLLVALAEKADLKFKNIT